MFALCWWRGVLSEKSIDSTKRGCSLHDVTRWHHLGSPAYAGSWLMQKLAKTWIVGELRWAELSVVAQTSQLRPAPPVNKSARSELSITLSLNVIWMDEFCKNSPSVQLSRTGKLSIETKDHLNKEYNQSCFPYCSFCRDHHTVNHDGKLCKLHSCPRLNVLFETRVRKRTAEVTQNVTKSAQFPNQFKN